MINERANELMGILSHAPHSELDPKIVAICTNLIGGTDALKLLELRIMHNKFKTDDDTLYPPQFQIAIEMVLFELEMETTHIMLDKCANDE